MDRMMLIAMVCVAVTATAYASPGAGPAETAETVAPVRYCVGVGDILDINILQPQELEATITIAPDGSINYPYIGAVQVKGLSLEQIQEMVQARLADGYMKYPVVSVSLKENRSKKYFVYGEVIRPGTYSLQDNVTVLKAISIAGGFTKFGSSSRVKVLREHADAPGYETIKINLNAVMNGDSKDDIVLKNGDVLVVSEGIF